MLALHPARLLFLSTLMLGAFIALSSSSWFTAWLGLELNLLSFIPLIASKSNTYSSEAALKYFLIQALGSSIILASAAALIWISLKPTYMILSALLLKMGAAPVHFWFPSVMQGIGWSQCMMLMTIQKVAPMLMISYVMTSATAYMILISSILSSLAGGVGGLNQVLMRKIMAYSSINHMAWMLAAVYVSTPLWLNYFIVYSIVSATVVSVLHSQQIFHFSHLSSLTHQSTLTKVATIFALLSLGGLPPFLGFIPKMMVIQHFVADGSLLWLSILLFSALITLFYYLRVITAALTLSSPKMKGFSKFPMNSTLMALSFINLFPLLTPALLVSPI
uniref:NADH-ubiquinone oxidoreductase chain 2 n=1 Tax=Chlorotocus crassicornis TaxID=1073559 RepID=A0A343J2P5_9EUCA|nr:NADH dehydrogenase subunit 2 [Chlorotocus crassicornis]ASU92687.1 NADH dehydrogenase subunit 2 [Chlorotocus crassicornis]